MIKDKKKYIKIGLSLFLLLTYIIACAKIPSQLQLSPEDVLKERVMAYIDSRMKGEFEKSYGYEDPLFRKKVSEENYIYTMTRGAFKWVGADIKEIAIEGEKGVVRIVLRGQPLIKGLSINNKTLIESTIPLTWIKSEGVWYNSLQDSM
jgi:hypothetical protein